MSHYYNSGADRKTQALFQMPCHGATADGAGSSHPKFVISYTCGSWCQTEFQANLKLDLTPH